MSASFNTITLIVFSKNYYLKTSIALFPLFQGPKLFTSYCWSHTFIHWLWQSCHVQGLVRPPESNVGFRILLRTQNTLQVERLTALALCHGDSMTTAVNVCLSVLQMVLICPTFFFLKCTCCILIVLIIRDWETWSEWNLKCK